MKERPPTADELDRRLFEKVTRGDARAFGELMRRHERRAFVVARGILRDDEDAREVVQDAFFRVWRRRDQYAGQATVSTWLYRIVYNLAVDAFRRRRARPTVPVEDRDDGADERFYAPAAQEPDVALQRRQLAEALNGAVARLPPHHRTVLVLRELDGLSYSQIATRMGLVRGTVMSRLFHARRKVQRALAESGPLAEE